MKSRLEELYKATIRSELGKELSIANTLAVPAIKKIVVNIGIKDAVGDSKILVQVKAVLEQITGQIAVRTVARNSIASFKLRQGMPIGVKVTLRRTQMYHFLDKLVNVVLPSVRDFQGVSLKFDGHGNYNLGLKDWMVFPEIDYDKVDKSRGMNITIHTNTDIDEHACALLRKFNMPFQKK